MSDSPPPSDRSNTSDRDVSALISKSLMGLLLDAPDQQEVERRRQACRDSRMFELVSRRIQESVATDTNAAPPDGELCDDARQRLKESLAVAVSESSVRAVPDRRADHVEDADWKLAARLLESGHISENQLAAVIQHWNPQSGHLRELLVSQGSVCPEMLEAACRAQQQSDSELVQSGRWKSSAALAQMEQLQSRVDDPSLATPPARQTKSRFTLIRKLAEGGLGVVWIARDEQLKRIVAVKEMHRGAAQSEKAWRRFRREAEITGSLEHPNVVPLYLFGEDPVSGNLFYAMRFVGKRTLSEAIAQYHERRQSGEGDRMDLHRLLTAFLGACQGIAYAHSRGVIHRDLKPENVAIDSFGQVIVLDWGLAKLTHSAELASQSSLALMDEEDSALTRTMDGEVIGTPLYMAPEQASGDSDNVDERTDVYGLGAILFSILTGDAPHAASVRRSSGLGEVQTLDPSASAQALGSAQEGQTMLDLLRTIAAAETPTARAINPAVPQELDAICQKAMNRKPYARFSSAAELADAVESWVAGQREKQASYDDMRMEGREVRANLLSSVWDLGTNVRFMAKLPPIQEIINATIGANDAAAECGQTDDPLHLWRDRLATIYQGLLGANRDYTSVSYSRVEADGASAESDANGTSVHELVRIERHSADHSMTRIVPRSRLLTYNGTPFSEQVWRQNPEEVSLEMTQDCRCPNTITCSMRMVGGVPVFDQTSEEPFGFVTIECDLGRVLDRQSRSRRSDAYRLIVVAPNDVVVLDSDEDSQAVGEPVAVALPDDADAVLTALKTRTEYIDETDREVYATRVELNHSLAIKLIYVRRRG